MRNPFVGMRSALLEFKNFRASGWLMFSICTVALIPLIYAGLFLLAFLDPYGSLANVPAAVVNLDKGAVIDDEQRNVGQELCDELVQNNEDAKEGEASGYKWTFTSRDDADDGLRNARYYM
ncbi:MAG: YhgE/Pip domain-containing protein, partial [Coriobacteriales bacterium]